MKSKLYSDKNNTIKCFLYAVIRTFSRLNVFMLNMIYTILIQILETTLYGNMVTDVPRWFMKYRSSHQSCSLIIGVLRNFAKFTGKHLCQTLSEPQACNFIKNETLAQMFSCEFCKISKITFFTKHLRTTASKYNK